MGIAALVIGIVAVILGLVPGCGLVFGLPPAVIGLILGIIEIAKKSKKGEKKGMGVAGVILNVIAIIVIIIWTVFIAVAGEQVQGELENIAAEMEKAAENVETPPPGQ